MHFQKPYNYLSVMTANNPDSLAENNSSATPQALTSEQGSNFLYTEQLYELEDVIEEYKELNETLIEVMDRFDNIFMNESVYVSDFKYLNRQNFIYTKRRIRKARTDNNVLNYDIFSNVLQSTLREAYEASQYFFGSANVDDWDDRVNKYREDIIRFARKDVAALIKLFNQLYVSLRHLYLDFNIRDDSFQANFNFEIILQKSELYDNPVDSINYLNSMILECKKVCLSGQISNVAKGEEDKFILKCNKAIEIIKLAQQPPLTAISLPAQNPQSDISEELISDEGLSKSDIDLNRQCIALYYMLNEIDSGIFGRNKSEIARFMQLITDKSYHNIYKFVKNPIKDPGERVSKKYQNDIHFMVDFFRKLGLKQIAAKIENDNLIG